MRHGSSILRDFVGVPVPTLSRSAGLPFRACRFQRTSRAVLVARLTFKVYLSFKRCADLTFAWVPVSLRERGLGVFDQTSFLPTWKININVKA